MTLSANDITFTLSGGIGNADPLSSLGGESSVHGFPARRLFTDITENQAEEGYTDFRCFYINNESDVDTLHDAGIYISQEIENGGSVRLGFSFQNERQDITIGNGVAVTGGSFEIKYTTAVDDYEITVDWIDGQTNWANSLQDGLRSIPNLEGVTVTAESSGSTLVFHVDFVGTAKNRYHDVLELVSNNLIGSVSFLITKVVPGGPINQPADEIDLPTTPPNNITFIQTTAGTAASIGNFRPLDSVPVWVRRSIPANTDAMDGDGFTIEIKGTIGSVS